MAWVCRGRRGDRSGCSSSAQARSLEFRLCAGQDNSLRKSVFACAAGKAQDDRNFQQLGGCFAAPIGLGLQDPARSKHRREKKKALAV